MSKPIIIPLINPNEPEALLAAVYIQAGQQVVKGDLICSLETTKSTNDILAESDGFLVGLRFEPGDMVMARDIFGYLADSPDWAPLELDTADISSQPESPIPDGLRITQPALTLARQHHIDLAQLPKDELVTEKGLRTMMADPGRDRGLPLKGSSDPTALVIYGGGGHGKSVLDLINAQGKYNVKGFIDDGVSAGEVIMGQPVLGDGEMLAHLYSDGIRLAVNAVGGIGNLAVRRVVFQRLLAAGFGCPTVAHPRAVLEPSADLASGVQVFPFAYVGSEVRAGFGTIINTGAIVSHECVLGDMVNVSPGAILAGGVQIGDGALIGMGVTVNLQVRIGRGARIGNGATVKQDVPDGGIVPAGTIWPIR